MSCGAKPRDRIISRHQYCIRRILRPIQIRIPITVYRTYARSVQCKSPKSTTNSTLLSDAIFLASQGHVQMRSTPHHKSTPHAGAELERRPGYPMLDTMNPNSPPTPLPHAPRYTASVPSANPFTSASADPRIRFRIPARIPSNPVTSPDRHPHPQPLQSRRVPVYTERRPAPRQYARTSAVVGD